MATALRNNSHNTSSRALLELRLAAMVIKLLSSTQSQMTVLHECRKCLTLSVVKREQILLHSEMGRSEPFGLRVWLCSHVYCSAAHNCKDMRSTQGVHQQRSDKENRWVS